MGCQSSVALGDYLTFSVCTHDPSTGALTDADSAPIYRVYEDETATPILTGTMAILDDANTLGFYTEQITCSAGNGFDGSKSYTVYIEAAVSAETGGISYGFTVDTRIDTIDTNVGLILADTGTDGVLVSSAALTSIAAAVWDRLTSALTTASSIGAYLLSKLGLITSSTTITVGSAVSGTTVTTYRGDDYDNGDGTALEWTVSSTATLSGGTIAVIVKGVASFVGAVVDETTVRLEVTDTQTATIPVGSHNYQVILTQPDSDIITLVDGTWTSKERYTA